MRNVFPSRHSVSVYYRMYYIYIMQWVCISATSNKETGQTGKKDECIQIQRGHLRKSSPESTKSYSGVCPQTHPSQFDLSGRNYKLPKSRCVQTCGDIQYPERGVFFKKAIFLPQCCQTFQHTVSLCIFSLRAIKICFLILHAIL